MRKRKLVFLFVALLVAFGLLFTGGEARALTLSYQIDSINVYSTDTFITNATYEYTFSKAGESNTIGYIDFEIPISIPFSSTNYSVVNPTNAVITSIDKIDIGLGDLGTKFAVGDIRYWLLKVNLSVLNVDEPVIIPLTLNSPGLDPGLRFGFDPAGAVLIKAGNGANTQSFLTKTPTTVAFTPPPLAPTLGSFSADPLSINSGEQPLCSTLSWLATDPSTVEISVLGTPIASGLNSTGSMLVCPEVTTVYTATASNDGGSSDPKAVTVTVNAPVIQTSCTQIIKQPVGGNPTCLHVCFEIGGEKRLTEATKFDNADCSGEGTPLVIFGPDVDDPTLRVSALACNPCGFEDESGNPTSVACSEVPYAADVNPPFDIETPEGTKRCEIIQKEYEPSGFTLDLGADPSFWNGSRWVTY